MVPDQRDFMHSRRLPHFSDTQQAAWLIGCLLHEVPILVSEGLLTPVGGDPGQHEKRLFDTAKLENLVRNDPAWPSKARKAIRKYWRRKNQSRRSPDAKTVSGKRHSALMSNGGDQSQRSSMS